MPAPTFPSTRWSRFARADDGAIPRQDLEFLFEAYHRPIAAWIRHRWRGLRDDEAADATQDFCLWILSSGFLEKASRERGRFRGFVKTALDRWMIDRHRATTANRRGGGVRTLPIGADVAEEVEPVDPRARTPDDLLDREWRRELVARALDAVRLELEATGRRVYFDVFHAWFLSGENVDHRALAERHGLQRHDVSNYLRVCKQRYRARLRAMVQETVWDEEALAMELGWLFGEVQ